MRTSESGAHLGYSEFQDSLSSSTRLVSNNNKKDLGCLVEEGTKGTNSSHITCFLRLSTLSKYWWRSCPFSRPSSFLPFQEIYKALRLHAKSFLRLQQEVFWVRIQSFPRCLRTNQEPLPESHFRSVFRKFPKVYFSPQSLKQYTTLDTDLNPLSTEQQQDSFRNLIWQLISSVGRHSTSLPTAHAPSWLPSQILLWLGWSPSTCSIWNRALEED